MENDMLKHGFLWSGVIALGMAACGGSSDDDSSPPTLALEEVPAAYAKALCNLYQRCNPFARAWLPDSDCEAYFQNTIENQGFADIVDAIDNGRATYNGQQMASCLDSISSRACEDIDAPDPESCDKAALGSVARGEDCTTDIECEGDSICDFSNSCPGVCAGRLNAGEACSGDDQCKDNLTCSTDTDQCVEPALAGEDCEGGVAPVCADALFCVGDDEESSTPGTCKPVAEVFSAQTGEACDLDEGPYCVEGAACVVDELTEDGATFQCVKVAGNGEACLLGAPNPCEPGLRCAGLDITSDPPVIEGTCAPTLSAGAECDPILPFDCGFNAACIPDANDVHHCVSPKNNGVSCTLDAECWSENCNGGGCAPTSACRQ